MDGTQLSIADAVERLSSAPMEVQSQMHVGDEVLTVRSSDSSLEVIANSNFNRPIKNRKFYIVAENQEIPANYRFIARLSVSSKDIFVFTEK